MKIVRNRWLPPRGYAAMVIGPWILTRRAYLSEVTVRHESIHWEQQKELAVVLFYVLYMAMFVVELVRCAFNKARGTLADGVHRTLWDRAYHMIPLEREAYRHELDEEYLEKRRRWEWVRRWNGA